jgi:hypothetical protein
MREDARHNMENVPKQLDKLEWGDGETERNARRASERREESRGIKQKYLGKKNPFKI